MHYCTPRAITNLHTHTHTQTHAQTHAQTHTHTHTSMAGVRVALALLALVCCIAPGLALADGKGGAGLAFESTRTAHAAPHAYNLFAPGACFSFSQPELELDEALGSFHTDIHFQTLQEAKEW